jgi:hypothetical protein
MKTYLVFNTDGEVTSFKTNIVTFNLDIFKLYHFKDSNINYTSKSISYNNELFILLYDSSSTTKNITSLPFINYINGDFILIKVDENNTIKSITENNLYKIIDKNYKLFYKNNKNNDIDYSSEDFD